MICPSKLGYNADGTLGTKGQYLISEYKRGRHSTCLAEEVGVSASTMILFLKDNGVELRPRGKTLQGTLELATLARTLREQGQRWKTISRKIGLHEHTLRCAVKRFFPPSE